MAITQRTRLGALVLVLALVGGVTIAAVATSRGSGGSRANSDVEPAQAGAGAAAVAAPRPIPSATIAPVATNLAVQKQLAYVLAHWSNYNVDSYGVVTDNDCVNFASQSLIARGWTMDDDWWADGTGADFDHSNAWVSSTSLRNYLAESGRATALTADQSDQVKLGDIVQFDWDNSGDRDHTGIVTRIERSGGVTTIYYGGHTDDTDYRSVDWAITVHHPGASVYYWSIP